MLFLVRIHLIAARSSRLCAARLSLLSWTRWASSPPPSDVQFILPGQVLVPRAGLKP